MCHSDAYASLCVMPRDHSLAMVAIAGMVSQELATGTNLF